MRSYNRWFLAPLWPVFAHFFGWSHSASMIFHCHGWWNQRSSLTTGWFGSSIFFRTPFIKKHPPTPSRIISINCDSEGYFFTYLGPMIRLFLNMNRGRDDILHGKKRTGVTGDYRKTCPETKIDFLISNWNTWDDHLCDFQASWIRATQSNMPG